MGISNKVLVALAAVLGIGILAKREDVGAGLGGLGTGLSAIGAGLFDVGVAPFKSVGLGLGYAAGGITAFSTALGDVGRGIADLLAGLKLPPYVGPGGAGSGTLPRPDDRNGNGLLNGNGTGGVTPGTTKVVGGVTYVWDLVNGGWGWRSLAWML